MLQGPTRAGEDAIRAEKGDLILVIPRWAGLFFKAFTLNVGCAFIRPNRSTVQLMDNVFGRLSSAQGWDQQIFNEEVITIHTPKSQ